MSFQAPEMYVRARARGDRSLTALQTDLYALFRALSIPNIVVLLEVRCPTPLEYLFC